MSQFTESNILCGSKVQTELVELESDLVVVAIGQVDYVHLRTHGARLLDQSARPEHLVVGMRCDDDDPIVSGDGRKCLLRKNRACWLV